MSFCRPITRLVRAAAAAFWLVTMNANAVAMSTQTTKIVLSAIERDSLKFMCLSSSPRVEPESNCSAKGCEPYKKLRPGIVLIGSDAPSILFLTWNPRSTSRVRSDF